MKKIILILTFLIVAPAGATTNIDELVHAQKIETFENGKVTYKQFCMACHVASNIMVSSPKFGDRKDWGERLQARKGIKNLVKSAMNGRGAMPKKGRCINCNENKLHDAILYMMRGQEN